MTSTILGLDVGTNSLGWSLLECDSKGNPTGIVDMGSRVFQEAVESKTYTPKNQARQAARSARRRNARRRMRRETLMNALVESHMLPETEDERIALFRDNLQYNPYDLRRRGLDEQLTLLEFGRAVYHLNQRRGFQSNRKTAKPTEDGPVKEAIKDLQKKMNSAGARTVGEYLSKQKKKRARHTHREMLQAEFETLWLAQAAYSPDILTEALKTELHRILFWQRPLSNRPGRRSPSNPNKRAKNPIGKCPFEPGRRRASAAWPVFQKFRILQDLNNLRIIDPASTDERKLTHEERSLLYKELNRKNSLTWNAAKTILGIHEGEKFNLEEGGKRNLRGNTTSANMISILKTTWEQWPEEKQEALVTDLLTIPETESLLRRLQEYWKFSPEIANKLAKKELESRIAHLSVKALKKILPYLEEGMRYDQASRAAGYDHSSKAITKEVDLLPPPPMLRNPVVRKSLFEVRKVVNALIKRYGKPVEIRLEMARELKKTSMQKKQADKQKRENEARNERIKQTLKKEYAEFQDREPRPHDILRYKLWEECCMVCPYTGSSISREMLFSGEVDIEHIIPYSRSLDDSFMNKTLCMAKENREVKRNRTPWETYGDNEDRWNKLMVQIKHTKMPPYKRQLFKTKEVDTEKFTTRQLVDTQYIARETLHYLKQLGCEVVVCKGATTAALRRKWKLNEFLAAPGADCEKKNRMDHRHHAIDAVVIALTSRQLFHVLSTIATSQPDGKGLNHRDFSIPLPWLGFREDVRQAVNRIIVSHQANHKIRGALHEETAYGLVSIDDKRDKVKLTYRVRLDAITPKQFSQIRDDGVKSILEEHLDQLNYDATNKDHLKKAFAEPVLHRDCKTRIETVRILIEASKDSFFGVAKDKDKPFKHHPFGSNHHVEIIENVKTGKRKGVFVTMMEAARRARIQKLPVVQRDHGSEWKFIMSLCINDMVKVETNGEVKIYRVQYLDGSNEVIACRLHNEATLKNKDAVLFKRPSVFSGEKIQIDPIGIQSLSHD